MMMGWYLTSDVVSGEVEVAHIIPLPSPMSTFQGRECLEVERSVIWDVLNRYVPSLSSYLNSAEDVDRVDNAITLVPCLHTAFKKKKKKLQYPSKQQETLTNTISTSSQIFLLQRPTPTRKQSGHLLKRKRRPPA